MAKTKKLRQGRGDGLTQSLPTTATAADESGVDHDAVQPTVVTKAYVATARRKRLAKSTPKAESVNIPLTVSRTFEDGTVNVRHLRSETGLLTDQPRIGMLTEQARTYFWAAGVMFTVPVNGRLEVSAHA